MKKFSQINEVKEYSSKWDAISFLPFYKEVRENCSTSELTMKDLVSIYKELFN